MSEPTIIKVKHKYRTASGGWGITSILALILSWLLNHSVGWCVLHFFLGWIYLLWAAIVRTAEVRAELARLFG